ncbi:hypothetical protein ACFPXP_07975 [Marinicrinis lubricantis]|uniref:Uncharacterized protein n=1 Tax=Marinicrinis lubricantis TaxID=2086470 RepID=A0ABW1IMS9_9BACL
MIFRFTGIILVFTLLCLSACSNNDNVYNVNNITANIEVVDKTKPERGEKGESWIHVIYLEGTNKKVMKLKVENKNIWNLIEINRSYTATFTQDNLGEYQLHEITPF